MYCTRFKFHFNLRSVFSAPRPCISCYVLVNVMLRREAQPWVLWWKTFTHPKDSDIALLILGNYDFEFCNKCGCGQELCGTWTIHSDKQPWSWPMVRIMTQCFFSVSKSPGSALPFSPEASHWLIHDFPSTLVPILHIIPLLCYPLIPVLYVTSNFNWPCLWWNLHAVTD